MGGLREVGSSLCRDEATEERSTIDDNGIGCDEATEKGSIVDDNGVGSTSFERSGLGGIGSSLYCGRRLRRR